MRALTRPAASRTYKHCQPRHAAVGRQAVSAAVGDGVHPAHPAAGCTPSAPLMPRALAARP